MRADVWLFDDGRVAAIFNGILCSDKEYYIESEPDIKQYNSLAYYLMKIITGSDLIQGATPLECSRLSKEIKERDPRKTVFIASECIANTAFNSKTIDNYSEDEKDKMSKNIGKFINGKITEESKENHPLFTLLKEHIITFCDNNIEISRGIGLYDKFIGRNEVEISKPHKIYVSNETKYKINKLKEKYNDWQEHASVIKDFRMVDK
jgi:hypothetical protein